MASWVPYKTEFKLELAGDTFRGKTFPKIRLQGQWLEALGFKPNGRVAIIPAGDGALLLKFIGPHELAPHFQLNESAEAPPQKPG